MLFTLFYITSRMAWVCIICSFNWEHMETSFIHYNKTCKFKISDYFLPIVISGFSDFTDNGNFLMALVNVFFFYPFLILNFQLIQETLLHQFFLWFRNFSLFLGHNGFISAFSVIIWGSSLKHLSFPILNVFWICDSILKIYCNGDV